MSYKRWAVLDVQEIRAGFDVLSMFAADSTPGEGLLNVFDAGWEHCRVGSLPTNIAARFVIVGETLGIEEDALVRLTLDVMRPSDEIVGILAGHTRQPESGFDA